MELTKADIDLVREYRKENNIPAGPITSSDVEIVRKIKNKENADNITKKR